MSGMKRRRKAGVSPVGRHAVVAGAGVCFALLSQKVMAATGRKAAMVARSLGKATFAKDSEATGMLEYAGIHDGKGSAKVKFFAFGGAPNPAHFIIYDLPPGASEGVHVHFLDNRNEEGSFDEYYYIVSGQGQMEIDGVNVPVAAGDHVHTPLEVAHGIENTHATDNLRVFLTFIRRGTEKPAMRRPIPKSGG
ncbi:MAG: cupin domain-containing protein [Sphingobium sp.]